MVDTCEQERKASLRKPRWRFERGIRVRERACDRKRWAWQAYVWKKYGLAAWDIALQWNLQGGKCPLCDAKLETKVWVIDHDHKTGVFRGILDGWCNHRVLSMIERGGRRRALGSIVYLGWANCTAFGLIQASL